MDGWWWCRRCRWRRPIKMALRRVRSAGWKERYKSATCYPQQTTRPTAHRTPTVLLSIINGNYLWCAHVTYELCLFQQNRIQNREQNDSNSGAPKSNAWVRPLWQSAEWVARNASGQVGFARRRHWAPLFAIHSMGYRAQRDESMAVSKMKPYMQAAENDFVASALCISNKNSFRVATKRVQVRCRLHLHAFYALFGCGADERVCVSSGKVGHCRANAKWGMTTPTHRHTHRRIYIILLWTIWMVRSGEWRPPLAPSLIHSACPRGNNKLLENCLHFPLLMHCSRAHGRHISQIMCHPMIAMMMMLIAI